MTPEAYLASKQKTFLFPHGCVELVSMKDALEAVRMTRNVKDAQVFMVEQDETGDLELNEFENAVLEILDFTARSVLANNKMPKFRRLQQLSKEWSVNLLDVAKKVVEDEYDKQKKDVCEGCNNVKGCITCTNGSEWAHISEPDIESDCSTCMNYEGFFWPKCKEFGYNFIEHCKEYIKDEG